jgi:TrmH family RNA methyltransferase
VAGTPIREITSLTNSSVKDVRALHMRKAREETGLFLAEGVRTVREALDLGIAPVRLLYVRSEREHRPLAQTRRDAQRAGAEIIEVSAQVMEKIARRENAQSVIGVFRQRLLPLSTLDPASAPLWVALEGVRDPGNLGTVIRTADACGAGGVILIGTVCDPYSLEAVRATMGSIFAVPIFTADTQSAVALLQRWPGACIGTALQTETDYRDARFDKPTLIVSGAEQHGLSDDLRAACKTLVKLPMRGRADSLNLAVATGVMLYAALTSQERR